MRPAMLVPLLAVGWALLAPLAGAAEPGAGPQGPAPTTLHVHLHGFRHFPLNTQPPQDLHPSPASFGLASSTVSCVAPTGQQHHSFFGFVTPAYVEYGFMEDGRPRVHPERHLPHDVLLDAGKPPVLHWFVATTSSLGSGADQAPLAVPEVAVRATVRGRVADDVGPDTFGGGRLIALGETPPARLAGPLTEGASHAEVGGRHVYGFVVPLAMVTDTLARNESAALRVDILLRVPGCDSDPDRMVMPSLVEAWSSPEARPRLELAVRNPIRIERLHAGLVGDHLVVQAAASSPWGNYDVDETVEGQGCGTWGGISLRVSGPGQAPGLCRVALVQRSHEHGHHAEAVEVAFAWPFREDGAPDGLYNVTLEASNDQGTAMAQAVAGFRIGPEPSAACATCEGGEQAVPADAEEAAFPPGQDLAPPSPDADAGPACCLAGEAAGGTSRGTPGPGPLPLAGALALGALLRRRGAAPTARPT
jgi:hypothetical protein